MTETQTAASTAELIRQAQQGSRDAMAALYEQTADAVYRTIRALVRDPEQARDIQQEVYLRAFTSIGQLRDPAKLLPWLRQIAQNQAKTMLKKGRPVLFSELRAAPPENIDPDPDVSPEDRLEADEQSAAISQVLDVLGDSQRMIVGMYYYEQLSVREIAHSLGISQSGVKSQLSRGRKRIRQELAAQKKRGVHLYGGAFPFLTFVRHWRTSTRSSGSADVLRRVLTRLGGNTLKTGHAAVFLRAAATAATVTVLGATAIGLGILPRLRQSGGEMRPPTVTEIPVVSSPTEDGKPIPPPEETKASAASVPTEPAMPDAQTAPPEQPAAYREAVAEPVSAADAPEAQPTLPTTTTLPSYLGEFSLVWPNSETIRFQTDELLLVQTSDPALTVTSQFDGAWQTVTLLSVSAPAEHVLVSVCRDNGLYGWSPLAHVTVLANYDD